MKLSLLEEQRRCAKILIKSVTSPAVIATIMGISEGKLRALLDNATVAQLVEHGTHGGQRALSPIAECEGLSPGVGVEGSSPSGGSRTHVISQ